MHKTHWLRETREKAEHDTANRNFGLQTLGSELDDPKHDYINYDTRRWCSNDPFAPTPNSPTLSISSPKFDELVLERRPQPLSKRSSLLKTTDSLPIPSSPPTMNSENPNHSRTGNSIQCVQLFLKMIFLQSNIEAKMILTLTPPIGSPMRLARN